LSAIVRTLEGGQSARGVIGRIRRQLAGFALSRHRADLARLFQCAVDERHRHRKAATRALDILPTLAIPQAQVSDAVDVWLPARVVPLLQQHGIRTLADLTVRIPRRRHWWHTIPGLGVRSARHIETFFAAHPVLTERARTPLLLKYLNEPELRRTIHAATNKSEQFNDFAHWLMFGGEGVIAENVRHEQRKVIKYNHLAANMVILYNVQWMSRKLKELQAKGHPVDAEVLKVLSPYRREHINRFGDYLLDLLRPIPPLNPTIDFAFKPDA